MNIKNIFLLLFTSSLFIQASCGNVVHSVTSVFSPKTPREAYEQMLRKSGADETPEGRQWKAASEMALAQPVTVSLPYRHHGQFPAAAPLAVGLRFNAKRGSQLQFSFSKKVPQDFALYADVFAESAPGETNLLYSADTASASFTYNIDEEGVYILRLQPELLKGGNYSLSIGTGPSISFPVAGKSNIGSFWGADRDGGKRRHEGVDIFATKGTPAIASIDGVVTGVREGGIGGKVVWLRSLERNFTLYYAHLDSQMVQIGQFVKIGDTLGLVGNTGNARLTPAHLHFGIYTGSGAVDPLPFVNRTVKEAPAIAAKPLTEHIRLTKRVGTINANTVLLPLAVTKTGYLAALPDGQLMQVLTAAAQPLGKALKSETAAAPVALLSLPTSGASTQATLPAGSKYSVLGYFNEYTFIRTGEQEGWITTTPAQS